MLLKILDALDHTEDELDLFVAVLFDGVVLEACLVLGELGDHLTEAGLVNTGKRVVVARSNRSTALALVDQRDLTEVITFFELANKLLTTVMISDFDTAVACAYKVHGHSFL